MRSKTRFLLALVGLVAPLGASAADRPVGRDAELGDPSRWYEPADTPRKLYETAQKEVRAALAEALKECRAAPARAECEKAAREQARNDLARARENAARGAAH